MGKRRRGPSAKLERTMEEVEAREGKEARRRADGASAVARPESRGFLEVEGELERTYKLKQRDLLKLVDENTRAKAFDLRFPVGYGRYSLAFSNNGRDALFASRNGHVCALDLLRMNKLNEAHHDETVRDACFLHDSSLFAVAQQKYVYVYDRDGVEIHCLRKHIQPTRVRYLHRHLLLVSLGRSGYLKWQDTSTGELVNEINTKRGLSNVMEIDPYNALTCIGHDRGTVTMWSPNFGEPCMSLKCHIGSTSCVAVKDRLLITGGLDKKIKVFDLRATGRKLFSYHVDDVPVSLDISQSMLLAVGHRKKVDVWKDALRTKARAPYMRHDVDCLVSQVLFRPYEDVLGIGHELGVSAIIIPGAGSASYDSREADPFETSKSRGNKAVQTLLGKLQPETIVLDPNEAFGSIDVDAASTYRARQRQELDRRLAESDKKGERRRAERIKLAQRVEEREDLKATRRGQAAEGVARKKLPAVFSRFGGGDSEDSGSDSSSSSS